jgi:3-hydroxybutyryl-CoA dehydrogenase
MTESAVAGVRERFRIDGDLEAAAKDADLVIEAAVEQLDIKRELFARLDQITGPEAILATNSSFIVSSKLAGATGRPGKVANLHFFNPALVMKLVEVVKGAHTADDTAEALMAFAEKCGKYPILIRREIDGFIVNRLQRAITEEAFFLVENGYVTPQELDAAAEKGLNYPLGPFRLMDMTGIDISYLSRLRRYEETGEEAQKPPAFLEEKYKKGELGKKTGKGWYDYSEK